ncbi:DUF3422 family protein [Chitinimonas naiadis]
METLSDPLTSAFRLNEHPQRRSLCHEAHARAQLPISTPARVSYLAYLHRNLSPSQELWLYRELATHYGLPPPEPAASSFNAHLGHCQLRWVRHGEFSALTIILPGDTDHPFTDTALSQLPPAWLEQLPGNMLVAAHAYLQSQAALPVGADAIASRYFEHHELIGAEIGDGAGRAYTDYQLHPDGFSRYLVVDRQLGHRQGGRMLQRLFEIDTYRMLAFLALPIARTISPELAEADNELAELTGAMSHTHQGNEPQLLQRLTQMAGRIESALSRTDHRFTAARAYHEIVRHRIAELREGRIQGLQPFQQFMERRLGPAMDTCGTVARRQRELAERVNRATALLRTRVDIYREQQNQQLLTSMARQGSLQLRLQETVEGLSIAAITYYGAGLVGYLFKAAKSTGIHLNVELATAISIPVIALCLALGLRRMRSVLKREYG